MTRNRTKSNRTPTPPVVLDPAEVAEQWDAVLVSLTEALGSEALAQRALRRYR